MVSINFNAAFDEEAEEAKPIDVEIVSSTPFDSKTELVKVISSFGKVEKRIVAMKKEVADLKITDAKSFENAGQRLIQCRQITKLVDKTKKDSSSYSEAKRLIDDINKFIREKLKQPINSIEVSLKQKTKEYSRAEAEIQRRIAAKKAAEDEAKRQKLIAEEKEKEKIRLEKEREEALARQKKLDKDAEKAGVEKIKIDIPEIPDNIEIDESAIVIEPVIDESGASDKIKVAGGAAKMKSEWKVEVIDASKVPRAYCSVDMKLLKKAVDSGVKHIDGCKIFEDYDMNVRVSSKNISDAFNKPRHEKLPW